MPTNKTRKADDAPPDERAAKRPARGRGARGTAAQTGETSSATPKAQPKPRARAQPKKKPAIAIATAGPSRRRSSPRPVSPPPADNVEGYVSADYSDQDPEARPAADAMDLFRVPDNFFGRLTGLLTEDADVLHDGIRRTTRTWGDPPDWGHLPVWDRVQAYERRLQERQIDGTEESLEDAHYRWSHPNLFAPQDHTGDTRKLMKQIDEAIAEWIDLAFSEGAPSWSEIRYADRDWLKAWAPRARIWLETERDFGYKDLLRAWVWRILWEQLFSPDAPADKWHGEHWINYAKLKRVWDESNEFPFNPDIPLWYRSTRFANARMLFARHSFHTSTLRLKDKILDPFRHLGAAHLALQERAQRSEHLLNHICHRAARLDMILISSPLIMDMSWSCPLTGWQHSFPFIAMYLGRHRPLMEARVRNHRVDAYFPTSLTNRPVDFIARPLLRIWGTVVQDDDGEGPIIVRDPYRSAYPGQLEPSLQVMIDNDEETIRLYGRAADDVRGLEEEEDHVEGVRQQKAPPKKKTASKSKTTQKQTKGKGKARQESEVQESETPDSEAQEASG